MKSSRKWLALLMAMLLMIGNIFSVSVFADEVYYGDESVIGLDDEQNIAVDDGVIIVDGDEIGEENTVDAEEAESTVGIEEIVEEEEVDETVEEDDESAFVEVEEEIDEGVEEEIDEGVEEEDSSWEEIIESEENGLLQAKVGPAENRAKAVIDASKDLSTKELVTAAEEKCSQLTDDDKALLTKEMLAEVEAAEQKIHHAAAVGMANDVIEASKDLSTPEKVMTAKRAVDILVSTGYKRYLDQTADAELLAALTTAQQAIVEAYNTEFTLGIIQAVIDASKLDLTNPASLEIALAASVEADQLTEAQLATVDKTKLREYEAAQAKITAYVLVDRAENVFDGLEDDAISEELIADTAQYIAEAKKAVEDAKALGVDIGTLESDLVELDIALDQLKERYGQILLKEAETLVLAAEKAANEDLTNADNLAAAKKAAEEATALIEKAKSYGADVSILTTRMTAVQTVIKEAEGGSTSDRAKAVIEASKDLSTKELVTAAEEKCSQLTDDDKALLTEEMLAEVTAAEKTIHHAAAVGMANDVIEAGKDLSTPEKVMAAKRAVDILVSTGYKRYLDQTADAELIAALTTAEQAIVEAYNTEFTFGIIQAVIDASKLDLTNPASLEIALAASVEADQLTEAQLATVDKTKLREYEAAQAKITAYVLVDRAENVFDGLEDDAISEELIADTAQYIAEAKKAVEDAKALGVDIGTLESDLVDLDIALDQLKERYGQILLKEAESLVLAAEKAANEDLTNADNLAAAKKAAEEATALIEKAKSYGADVSILTTRMTAVQTVIKEAESGSTSDNVAAYLLAAKKVPAASKIKEKNRKLIKAANKLYKKLTKEEKAREDVKAAKKAVKAATKALNKPTITFKNKKVTKALNKKGTKTKYIKVKAGKKLKLKAKSSTGAKITYKLKKKNGVVKVNKKGVITAKKPGKAIVLVKCKKKTVKVRIRVTGADFDGQQKKETR